MPEKQRVRVGSGDVYIIPFTGTIPADNTIETTTNHIGSIQKGAFITYTSQIIEVDADHLQTISRFKGKESVTFKTSALEWNLDNLSQLSEGKLTDDDVTGVRTLKIGSFGAKKLTSYLVHFVSFANEDGYKVRTTLIGNATNGFELPFNPDKESVINLEFKSLPMDSDGTQLIVTEGYEVED